MITLFLLGLTQACFSASEDSFPALETCTHEMNFEKDALPKVNSSKIIGGINAKDNQWPFITRLSIKKEDGRYLCGGTIIDNHWILT